MIKDQCKLIIVKSAFQNVQLFNVPLFPKEGLGEIRLGFCGHPI